MNPGAYRSPHRQRGLSLIELIFFIVIVGVGLAGVLTVLNLTVSKSADPMVRKQALTVASAMMEEILAKDYQNDTSDPVGCTPSTTPKCAPNTLLDRQNYNDVDDYNGWNQTGVYNLDGSPAPVLGAYTVNVTVAAATLDSVPPAAPVTGKQITVTVSGGGEAVTLLGFRANYE